eukprot:TRINITY_DN6211_c0_g1_i1.p1 TRINITY_DN6211_c0_g1~~TRINITY_DN6211_c0_g1_i1.p1  ORF type:complete len:365 (+),score=63.73 TRINITY_DN6211_c0_g1_i1:82-1176(+)
MEVTQRPRCCGSCIACLCCCRELCLFACCPPCPAAVTAKMAFAPPAPPTYEFKEENHRISMFISNPFEPDDPERRRFEPPANVHIVRDIRTRRGSTICAFYLEVADSPLTLLFSHGNAVDIGVMAIFLASLASQINCSIFAYDYTGYGLSSGRPREKHVYADVAAAYACLRERFGVPANRIVVYGQSIGTTATVDFASKHPEVAGVVLHSPLASGLRVLKPNLQRTYCCDPFPNIKKVPKIEQPTLIIHGQEDEVIAFSHGVQLHEACPGSNHPLWVAGAGHNDVEMYKAYGDRLGDFLETLAISASQFDADLPEPSALETGPEPEIEAPNAEADAERQSLLEDSSEHTSTIKKQPGPAIMTVV